MLNAIAWPKGFMPGKTDNYASNEMIVSGLTSKGIWAYLIDTSTWPKYYSNASDIQILNGHGTRLFLGARFKFVTFGLIVQAEVNEFVPPIEEYAARIAWHGWVEGNVEFFLDIHHAWLLEDLSENRVRILTQETQNGKSALKMAAERPNPMINAHQEWLEGLVKAAKDKI